MKKLAFIGLGTMGFPMAGHLKTAGHDVSVFNRSAGKARRWVESYGGRSAETLAEVCRGADAVMICVGADEDVRHICCAPGGVFEGLRAGAVIVDHTTTSAVLAREMAEVASQQDIAFVDAPVSGGQRGAEEGRLTIMAGGDEQAFDEVLPVLSCYARKIQRLGPSGSGQLAKMVNQICVAGVLQGLAEGIHFAQQAGLDIETLIPVLSEGAAQSWQMENRYRTMAGGEYDFGFAVDWMRKDLRYSLEEARRNGSHLPATALIDQFYSEVQALGGGRWDTSSLLHRLQALVSISTDRSQKTP